MGAARAACVRAPQSNLRKHEHAEDLRHASAARLLDLHHRPCRDLPADRGDDRRDAHPRHHKGAALWFSFLLVYWSAF